MDAQKKIFITQPLLPSISQLSNSIEEIWDTKWVTNMGNKHNELESKLKNVLKVDNVSLFNNGTIALLTALKALDLPFGSEVITTPFTFAATPHCISWNGLVPVFCDIEPKNMTIDVSKIEELITDKTTAILAVHVYGFPCDVIAIEKIAKKYNLKVIYDAAHAFTTEIDGVGIGSFGDITMFSFHATKLFNSIEGGCLTYNDPSLVEKIYNLRNFGIRSEELVEEVGINGKMNEVLAAIGLLNLELFPSEKSKREIIRSFYTNALQHIDGIYIPELIDDVSDSYQYYPIVIQESYPLSRDQLYEKFKTHNIMTRKYFYPLCSDYECYKNFPSSQKEKLIVANSIKHRVLCLLFYGDLTKEQLNAIISVIKDNV